MVIEGCTFCGRKFIFDITPEKLDKLATGHTGSFIQRIFSMLTNTAVLQKSHLIFSEMRVK